MTELPVEPRLWLQTLYWCGVSQNGPYHKSDGGHYSYRIRSISNTWIEFSVSCVGFPVNTEKVFRDRQTGKQTERHRRRYVE